MSTNSHTPLLSDSSSWRATPSFHPCPHSMLIHTRTRSTSLFKSSASRSSSKIPRTAFLLFLVASLVVCSQWITSNKVTRPRPQDAYTQTALSSKAIAGQQMSRLRSASVVKPTLQQDPSDPSDDSTDALSQNWIDPLTFSMRKASKGKSKATAKSEPHSQPEPEPQPEPKPQPEPEPQPKPHGADPAEQEEPEEEEEEQVDFSTKVDVVFVILTLVIVLSIGFELIKHHVEHFADEDMTPVVETLFGEITVLGFISLVIFVVANMGIIEKFSWKIFGEKEELQELIELIHMIIFLGMMILLIFVVFLISLGEKVEASWKNTEKICLTEPHLLVKHYSDQLVIKEQMGWQWYFSFPDMYRWVYSKRCLEFLAAREAFILMNTPTTLKANDTHEGAHADAQAVQHHGDHHGGHGSQAFSQADAEILRKPLPKEFKLGDYFSHQLGESFCELVEVPPMTWFSVWIIVVFVYGLVRLTGIKGGIIFFFLFIFTLTTLTIIARNNVIRIREELLPLKYELDAHFISKRRSSGHLVNLADIEENVKSSIKKEIDSPPYLAKPLPKPAKTWWQCLINGVGYGEQPNEHQALFLFGPKGPHFLLGYLRGIILMISLAFAVYIVTLFPITVKLFRLPIAILLLLLLLVAALLFIFGIVLTAANLVVVSSVEMMKKPDVIIRVQRNMSTEKTLRLLRMLSDLRAHDLATLQRCNPEQMKNLDKGISEKVDKMMETFDQMDVDKSQLLSPEEVIAVVKRLDYNVSIADINNTVTAMDTDHDGFISRDEFRTFMITLAFNSKNSTPADLVEFVFKMIDKNNSGTISCTEFKLFMDKIGMETSIEDIEAVIREIDRSKDGKINHHECLKFFEENWHLF